MHEWEKTNSPLIYWYKKLFTLYWEQRLDEFKMDFMTQKTDYGVVDIGVPIVNGLPFC